MPEQLRSQAVLHDLKQKTLGILGSGHGPSINQPTEWTLQLPDGTHRNVEFMTYTYRTNLGYRVGSIARDITKRKQIEMLLEYMATHDPLTDLPNRQLFEDRLKLAIDRARRVRKGILSVMILDLDNFKEVNDTHGHAYGDQLLKIIAERLGNCLRKSDTAARMGGDEFALINEEVNDLESAKLIAIKVLDAISRTMEIEGRTIQVTASIGISVYASDEDATTLLREADVAMYQAKRARNCYQIYNSS
jgi:diguanylate cyclase (GGDEF)-like protein